MVYTKPNIGPDLEESGRPGAAFEYQPGVSVAGTQDTDFPTWYAFRTPESVGALRHSHYGYGHNPWTGSDLIRAAPDIISPLPDAEHACAGPNATDLDQATEWVREHIPGLAPEPVRRSTCVAARPADPAREFFLGPLPERVPDGERVVVQAAGWAFNFVPMFGRLRTKPEKPPDARPQPNPSPTGA
ncbi:hypothetical protein [Embleya sp. NBC_00896]|uniref:hypothetical protein n=1 Tax=Embleya sp. NBC_00896 TaxID=2975961 RepID=UPI002F907168|nr:hypothetical protein OG928_38080 [Embleya sp. NBC_00896]